MANFDACFEELLDWEGTELHCVPGDPGGRTRYGISQRAYPGLDLERLTREQARDIYKRDYWDKAGCPGLPPVLRGYYFDCCVHHGIRQATRLLQRALGVRADGIMGPVTRQALCEESDPEALLFELRLCRMTFMVDLVDARPGQVKFLKGWLRRCFCACRWRGAN